MILFCQCGSDKVGVKRWDNRPALFECYTCQQSTWVEGFTLGKLDFVEQLFAAVLDQVRKYRERDPAVAARQRQERQLQQRQAERR